MLLSTFPDKEIVKLKAPGRVVLVLSMKQSLLYEGTGLCGADSVDGKDAPEVWGPELLTVLRLSIKASVPSPLRHSHHQRDQAPTQGKDPGTSTSKDHLVCRMILPNTEHQFCLISRS